MKKKALENVIKVIPDLLANAVDYLKNNFDENAQEILGNASGTAGVVIKLFAKPLLGKYFDNKTEKKLENFGLQIYVKSAILQANKSIELIEDKLDNESSPSIVANIIGKSMFEEINSFDKDSAILVFQPQYHPAVEYVKKSYERMLRELGANQTDINTFLKNYNENIETTIIKEFGDDYDAHLEKTKEFRLRDNEVKLLFETIRQGKIGFKPDENLKYETTYAQWEYIGALRESDKINLVTINETEEYEKQEQALKPINELIEEYFAINEDNHLNKILFTIADFGKGKSVFMRHYAAGLAKKYLETSEGYFPVYFNLRNFSKYLSDVHLGVISDFLETEYSIKIDDDYFAKKKYFFLIDSLDESGELNKATIDKVINSVKSIQKIDKTVYRTNRIIISSRPFDEGLYHHLNDHEPYKIKNKEDKDITCCLNIYGFTKVQFNDWLQQTLKSDSEFENISINGFAKDIVDAIKTNNNIDIYEKLLENGTLSRSELRRPIFSYMIYQLIIHNVDFMEVGKLGVYLSFLNLLTKEAKHINDPNYQVNLIEEWRFRNILHATTALWAYERQKGKQGMLKKADICRVLEGKNNNENDNEVLEKNKNITEIQFLSHSYFGENDNVLHFQHQSFAEILLAEYYLKIFIKYALDENADMDEARARLVVGEPTEQTIYFFKELLELLKETSVDLITPQIIEKRKLLFPLMASLSINKHNRLFCYKIAYSWFESYKFNENEAEYPKSLLEKWCIGQKEIDSILTFVAKNLNSKVTYQVGQATSQTALFDFEVIEMPANQKPTNYDKWLSLLVGNHLYNDVEDKKEPKLFNWDYEINPSQLFNLIKTWNYSFNSSSPDWGKNLFRGVNMTDSNGLQLSHLNFDGIDFSFSTFSHFMSWGANWCRTKLDYCCFKNVDFITSLFFGASIQNIRELKKFTMRNCQATSTGFILLTGLNTTNMEDYEIFNENRLAFISNYDIEDSNVFDTCSGFMIYGLKKAFFTIYGLKKLFTFEDDQTKKAFLKKIDSLKEYEVKKVSKRKMTNKVT